MLRCIDLETTGLEPTDAVCEIGWCDVVDGRVSKPWSLLVNPERLIPPEASAVHHITDADVADKDLAIKWPEAKAMLMKGSAGVYVAHHAPFERAFFDPPGAKWIDTVKVALNLYPEAPNHQLQTLRYVLKLDLDPDLAMPPHRAGPDTYVTAVLLHQMLKRLSAQTMIAISSRPAIRPRMWFGKHAGKPLAEVEASYLRWMLEAMTNDEDALATARHELKRRQLLRV